MVLWAAAFVGIRAVADDLAPGPFAFGRLLVARLGLAVLVALRRPRFPTERREWMLIGASGDRRRCRGAQHMGRGAWFRHAPA